MLLQLSLGTAMILVTLLVQVGFIATTISVLTKSSMWISEKNSSPRFITILCGLIVWLVIGLTVCCWSWAILMLSLDIFNTLESALYFSIVTFTTLGYGDITLDQNWRLLGSLCSVNGLIIVGLNTAFLVEALSRIRQAQVSSDEASDRKE